LHTLIHGSDVTAELCDDDHDGDGDEGHDRIFDGRGAGAIGREAPCRGANAVGQDRLGVVSVMVSLKLPTDRGERA
jgi:hypothetical protein